MKTRQELDAMQAECDKLWAEVNRTRSLHDAASKIWCEANRSFYLENLKAELRAEIERENAAAVTACNCDK